MVSVRYAGRLLVGLALAVGLPAAAVAEGADPEAAAEAEAAAESRRREERHVRDDPATEWYPEEDEERALIGPVDRGQAAVARGVFLLSRQLDRMLGTDDELYADEEYDSVARLRLEQRLSAEGDSRLEAGVSGRLRLPGAQDRLSLIITSDDYDDEVDAERGVPRDLDEDRTTSAGLLFLRPSENWSTSVDARLRSGSPVDLYTRARVWRAFQPGLWVIRPRQAVFWYDGRGAGTTTDIRLDHPVTGRSAVRLEAGATWFKREEQFYYDQRVSYYQQLSQRRALIWQVGARGESEPNNQLTQYYAQVRWRSVIHRDWLSLEIRPQLRRDREDDFRTERRLFIALEAAFGHPGAY
ncbi:hypothetical protein ACN2MM_08600 [Alkalilimnicola ehrlichii MLHE-1]|uniref:Uncharacterized protein n=1 Tax=Alkalilimnicola ehrlichii (strain ATCC BAA-1101 / DSM 17681 / MLHE-1) TaxID=187272 RepID=Q0A8B5_ALKEH|nr:hypothetical protein [Alkalilimnicola ehrlichii]ABI56922.1 hypothetical protein Mlg_1575 [Alkalilimnicola ehrlichii MLHE-1]